jgi:K+-sensing histidine kinase KdpD
MLGARLRVEEGEDVAAVAIAVARELGTTYVLMGTPSERRGLGRLALRGGGGPDLSLLGRMLRELPGVDVRIITDPTVRGHRAEAAPVAERAAK